MIENKAEKMDNMKTEKGIGLYKISYEMDTKTNGSEKNYIAGILAYTNKEAIDTLVDFCKTKVKGFKGFKVNEVAYEGGCHALSEDVRNAVVATAVLDGLVVYKQDHDAKVEKLTKENKKAKKSILAKEKK